MISGDRSVLRGRKGAFWQTLKGFAKHWERIDVICPRITGCELRVAGIEGIQVSEHFPNVFFHPCPHGLWYQSLWIRNQGTRLFLKHAHDVMTVHEYPPFYNGLGAYLLHRRTGMPYALEIHHVVGEPVAASFTENVGKVLSKMFLKLDALHAKAVRTVSSSVKQTLLHYGIPEAKIQLVPSFYLESELLQPDPAIQKRFDVVFSARLVSNKGFIELLDVVEALPGVTVLVLGDGPLLAQAQKKVEQSSLKGRVEFRGWVEEQSTLLRELQSAKIFVMNSKSEGGPRIALEAMACGMPTIATRVGVMPEVLVDGQNGIFTDGTAADLQQQISSLLRDDAKRERLGREACAVLKMFDRQLLLSKYASFLQSLAR